MAKSKKDDYKLRREYSSIVIDESKYLACERPNSKYKWVKIKQYGR